MATLSSRAPKEEGTISSVFTSLTGEAQAALPERFSALKKEMWRDTLVQSWREVLGELEQATERVASKGSEVSVVRRTAPIYLCQRRSPLLLLVDNPPCELRRPRERSHGAADR